MDYKTTIQALDYIAKNYKCDKHKYVNKMAALKLLYFAERYHLRNYGRMITDDTFFAMKNGPVASGAKDVLSFDDMNTDQKYTEEILENIDSYFYNSKNKLNQYDMLSETDIEALQFAIDKFGYLDEWGLKDETHKYPEWKRYEKSFLAKSTTRENIMPEDFFSDLISKEDPYKEIPQKKVEISKEFYIYGH